MKQKDGGGCRGMIHPSSFILRFRVVGSVAEHSADNRAIEGSIPSRRIVSVALVAQRRAAGS
jgi:hypothetical protein